MLYKKGFKLMKNLGFKIEEGLGAQG